jgi:hypothetical protein
MVPLHLLIQTPVPSSSQTEVLPNWGSGSDIVIAVVAVIALIVSVLTLVQQKRQADSQDRWQREQAKQQEDWRAEEIARFERWREEDIRRSQEERQSKVRVVVSEGRQVFGFSATNVIQVDAINDGSVPVQLSNRVGFILPGEQELTIPSGKRTDRWSSDPNLPTELAPGQRSRSYMDLRLVSNALRNAEQTGDTSIVGFIADQAGKQYESEPFVVHIN